MVHFAFLIPGQCFSSEAWGGRSANRGKCAQACRLSYDLIVDGQKKELDDLRYLLSPGDLYAIEQIPELVDIGVHCLKIEGRYKDENYVCGDDDRLSQCDRHGDARRAERDLTRRADRNRTSLLTRAWAALYVGHQSIKTSSSDDRRATVASKSAS